ncbi:MAG: hypothetical protein Q9170_005891 [Blastenia crenularia]
MSKSNERTSVPIDSPSSRLPITNNHTPPPFSNPTSPQNPTLPQTMKAKPTIAIPSPWPTTIKLWLLILCIHTAYTPAQVAAILSCKFDFQVTAEEVTTKKDYWTVNGDVEYVWVVWSNPKERDIGRVLAEAGMGLDMLMEQGKV